jgi:RNA polymerase sigma-70 factor (ECF subfamily)
VLGSDPHAFAGLYIRHRSSFTSHARRYLRDPRDADEVVQEAFLRLFLALPELETELQALAYCRRTITNLCIDRYRADARAPGWSPSRARRSTSWLRRHRRPGGPREDAALVRRRLSQLPELHRAALVKREIEEKPLPVIADELDVAEDSVKHLLFRARRALRKLLAGTAVAPGVDVELSRGLRPAARGASGGVAGLLLLALLGLGSGPDLRAVPVVGVDLPDVLGVTTVADAVGDAVREVVRAIVPRDEAQASAAGETPPADRPAARRPCRAPTRRRRCSRSHDSRSATRPLAGPPPVDPVSPTAPCRAPGGRPRS